MPRTINERWGRSHRQKAGWAGSEGAPTSLRRHDPDQVQGVCSQPAPQKDRCGHPQRLCDWKLAKAAVECKPATRAAICQAERIPGMILACLAIQPLVIAP